MNWPRRLGEDRPDDGTLAVQVGGAWYGPFDCRADARGWKDAAAVLAAQGLGIVTARELFEGSIALDEAFLLRPFEAGMGLHPTVEVWDVFVDDDNGRVVVDLPSSVAFLDADAAVVATNPQPVPDVARSLPAPVIPPARIDLSKDDVVPGSVRPHPRGGELFVARWPDLPRMSLACWRRDSRMTTRVRVLDAHSRPEWATARLRTLERGFSPLAVDLARGVSRREPDRQRSRAYRWEARVSARPRRLADLEECRDFVHGLYADLGEESPPYVSLGRPDLERSYWSRLKGIVLARDSLDTGTLKHESAHELAARERRRRRIRQPGHGSVFVGTLMGLMCRLDGADLDELAKAADDMGLEWDREAAERCAASSCPRPGR